MALLPGTVFGDSLKEWGLTLLDLVFPEAPLEGEMPSPIEPPFCEHCGERFEGAITNAFKCSNCEGRQWHFAWARAYYPAEGCVRKAILEFKYGKQFHQRQRLSKWLDAGFEKHAKGVAWDGLVPVPLHHLRQRTRGFNQALELATGLSKKRRVPVLKCLERLHDTGTQTVLSREERWHNLRNAFGLRSGFDVGGMNLLIIDDVFTTGATCEGCAEVLHEAGAGVIGVLTIARG